MHFPFFKKPAGQDVPREVVISVALAAVSLIVAMGTMRWAYLLLDEQIQLREDFMALQNRQDQLQTQFDHWDAKAGEQRAELRVLIEEAKK